MSRWSTNSSISFEQAVHEAAQLLGEIDSDRMDDNAVCESVASLVETSAGARGFFVTYLTDEKRTGDEHRDAVVEGLKKSPQIVNDLIAKNLVMSSAMALTHMRNDADQLLVGSERVNRRCMSLALRLNDIEGNLDSMLAAVESVLAQKHDAFDAESTLSKYSFGVGGPINAEIKADYEEFLRKWKYDSGQLKAARDSLQKVLRQLRKAKS